MSGVVAGRDGSAVVIKTADGATIRTDAPDGAPMGTEVEVAVRPEKIQMVAEPPPGVDNCLQGQVVDLVYQGVTTEYQVEVAAGRTVRVLLQNLVETWRGALFPVGSRVFLHWARGSSLLLHETPGAGPVETGEEDEVVPSRRF